MTYFCDDASFHMTYTYNDVSFRMTYICHNTCISYIRDDMTFCVTYICGDATLRVTYICGDATFRMTYICGDATLSVTYICGDVTFRVTYICGDAILRGSGVSTYDDGDDWLPADDDVCVGDARQAMKKTPRTGRRPDRANRKCPNHLSAELRHHLNQSWIVFCLRLQTTNAQN